MISLIIVVLVVLATALAHSTATNDQTLDVPVIDISVLMSTNNNTSSDEFSLREVVKEIGRACRTIGFFYIKNHGISDEVMNNFTQEMKQFFALPSDEKRRINRAFNNSRGFADNEYTKQKMDVKEIFDVGHKPYPDLPDEDEKNVCLDGYNQWPTSISFRRAVEAYYEACATLSLKLMKTIAMDLELPDSSFIDSFLKHTSFLRLNYYPYIQNHSAEISGNSNLGISRHTDAGALTILLQVARVNSDSTCYVDSSGDANSCDMTVDGGLEVYTGSKEDNADGQWVPVAPIANTLVINTGDMLQVFSNGEYRAPEHRVRASDSQVHSSERFSAPFFLNPPYESVVAPLVVKRTVDDTGQVVVTTREPKYSPLVWGEFRRRRFEGDYADFGREIQIEDFQWKQLDEAKA